MIIIVKFIIIIIVFFSFKDKYNCYLYMQQFLPTGSHEHTTDVPATFICA